MNAHRKPTASAAIDAAAARWIARRDAGLGTDEERELQEWIERDPRHRAALEFYSASWTALAKPAALGSGALFEKQLARLANRRRRRRLATAAALFLVLTSFLSLTMRERLAAPDSASALVLAPSHRILPDGSRVELKDHARISLDFSSSARRVTLEAGEAHFIVERDPTRPFVVSAATIDVRAIGTAFSVRKGPAAIEILVTHGHVAVEQPTPAPPDAAVTRPTPVADLEAGTMAVVAITTPTTAAEVRTVSPAELVGQLAWRSPRLEFTRTPLREAVALFNQHAPPDAPDLAIADPEVAALRVTGIFRADNLEGFVLLAEGTFGLKAERDDRTILLRRLR